MKNSAGARLSVADLQSPQNGAQKVKQMPIIEAEFEATSPAGEFYLLVLHCTFTILFTFKDFRRMLLPLKGRNISEGILMLASKEMNQNTQVQFWKFEFSCLRKVFSNKPDVNIERSFILLQDQLVGLWRRCQACLSNDTHPAPVSPHSHNQE